MTKEITTQLLDAVCSTKQLRIGQALKAADELGWLAPYWLARSVRECVTELRRRQLGDYYTNPLLPDDPGSCHIVFVNECPEKWSLLGQALLWPLRWEPDRPHSPLLPPDLVRVADDVLRVLSRSIPTRATDVLLAARAAAVPQQWGLTLNAPEDAEPCDLSKCPVGADSGWVPLAAALILRLQRLSPISSVWATGAWDADLGVIPVDGLPAKLGLARELGALEFFLPAALAVEARKLTGPDEHPQFGFLPAVEKDPHKALAPYLARLGAAPAASESWEVKHAYYRLQPTGMAASWYWKNLLPEIVHNRRQQVSDSYPGWAPTHVISIISGSPELATISPLAVGGTHCLLLFTAKFKAQLEQVKAHLESVGVRCTPALFDDQDDLEPQFRTLLSPFLATVSSSDHLVVDLTPGTKLMSLTLERLAPTRSWLVYLRHEFRHDKRAEPGSEFVLRFRAGEPPGPRLQLPSPANS